MRFGNFELLPDDVELSFVAGDTVAALAEFGDVLGEVLNASVLDVEALIYGVEALIYGVEALVDVFVLVVEAVVHVIELVVDRVDGRLKDPHDGCHGDDTRDGDGDGGLVLFDPVWHGMAWTSRVVASDCITS